MKYIQVLFVLPLVLMIGCVPSAQKEWSMQDRYVENQFTNAEYLSDRTYRILLPSSYATSRRSYPVLYMMDGQNLFFHSLAYGGYAWRADQVIDSLVAVDQMEEIIVVGIDNAGVNRFSEYMPQKPMNTFPSSFQDSMGRMVSHPLYADSFLQFLVKELKPKIDQQYRTQADASSTFVAGSSMGGLISMYALCEYPDVFGGAICMSTHWPIALDNAQPQLPAAIIDYFEAHLPKDKRWYFDYGTKGLDQYYEPYQQRVDRILNHSDAVAPNSWMSRKFEGHDHNERYWNSRFAIPLKFIFGQ